MNRKSFIILIAALAFYALLVFSNQNTEIQNPIYQTYIREYREQLSNKVKEHIDHSAGEGNIGLRYGVGSADGGTTGNFEGPQVHIEGIKFHNEFLTSADIGPRLKHLDGVSAHFDPDHTYYGLPDVKVSVKDVRLYNPHKGSVSEYLPFGNNDPKPYKIYKKKIESDSSGKKDKYFMMQLWLTEFEVTIDIRPDRDIPINIAREEQQNTTYPGFWYGSNQEEIKLDDLGKEHRDFRYGDLSFILKIIPDKSPIYVQTTSGSTSKADFAIGAIYCMNATFGNESQVQRISANIHSGQPVFLNDVFDFDKMNTNTYEMSESMEANAAKLLELKSTEGDFIWNKPYYIKLFFNNLGTWRSGIFNQNQFHDQVYYKFLMPMFVVGSWDVIAPQEVLPAWNPPPAFIREFSLKDLLPGWELGWAAKIGVVLLIAFIVMIALSIAFPWVLPLFRKIIR